MTMKIHYILFTRMRKPHRYASNTSGFTLIEIIAVLIIIGIVGAVISPFLGNVLGNYIHGRELAKREQQAGLILERFVRDVRMSNGNNLSIQGCTPTLMLSKKANDNSTYEHDGSNNLMCNDQLLARHVHNVCFKVQNASSSRLVSISFDLIIDDNMNLNYKASAVPRWN